ncbi:hypothetical protein CEV33_3316 [Brucella grignonensis]|uniref:Uncharacterized protein n=1 Tax=Brucella grignonensis TaxID=94627 RepID=A0A256F0F4_9HYPH|nr:hypothetical protein CEV33_3316 [Brucella grignonensis]
MIERDRLEGSSLFDPYTVSSPNLLPSARFPVEVVQPLHCQLLPEK